MLLYKHFKFGIIEKYDLLLKAILRTLFPKEKLLRESQEHIRILQYIL